MANIKLQNGWSQPEIYQNVAYVTFETDTEGVMATYYEGGSGTGGVGVQANWAQNDAQSPDHIKNRPFYSEYESIISSEVKFISDDTTLYTAVLTGYTAPNAHEYLITWGGELWLCEVEVEEGKKYFGNRNLDTGEPQSNEPPFAGEWNNDVLTLYTTQEGTIGFGLSVEGEIHQIAEKYLPEEVKQVPKPTEDDEGKLLGVQSGKWAIVPAPEGGSAENELPDIDLDKDKGKILMVSDKGTASWELSPTGLPNGKLLGVQGDKWAIVDAEKELPKIESGDDGKVLGVSGDKWAIVDAIKTAKIDIFPFLTVGGFAANEIFGNAYFALSPSNFTLVEGEIYYVEWDGATFPCECKSGTFGDMDILYLGNDRLLGGESGEPFTVGYYIDDGTVGFITNDNNKTSHNIYIYQLDRLGRADWNQNDKTQASYIKNRPFGMGEKLCELVKESTLNFDFDESQGVYSVQSPATDEQIALWANGDWNKAYVGWGGNNIYLYEPVITEGVGKIISDDGRLALTIQAGQIAAVVVPDSDFSPSSFYVKVAMPFIKKIDPIYLPDDIGGVPEITASDTEKVLTVEAFGAEAVWKTPARELPDVNTAENGAFLRIVNGEPAWVALTDVSIEGA